MSAAQDATSVPPSVRKASSSSADALAVSRVTSEISITGGLTLTSVVEFPDDECLIVRASLDRSLWAVGLASGRVQLLRAAADTAALVQTLFDTGCREKQTVTGLVFVPTEHQPQQQKSPGSLLLASYATGQIRMWRHTACSLQQQPPQLLWTLTEERTSEGIGSGPGVNNQILCLACSTDGHRFLTGGADGAIRVYDTRRRSLANLCQAGSLSAGRVDGHRGRVCALAYHPQGRRRPAEFGHLFVSGGWDNTIQIWDDRRPRSLWVYFGPHVCGSDAIDVDPAQGHILTGSWERHKSMLQVWKFNEDAAHGRLDLDDKSVQEEMLRGRPLGELQQDPTGTPSMGYVAQWLGAQYMVFGGSNANALKIVDRSTLNIVAGVVSLPKGVYSLASLSQDPNSAAATSASAVAPPVTVSETRRLAHRLAFCAGNRLYVMKFERK